MLTEAYWPRIVALGILLSFYQDFILVLPYFHFQSVLSKLQGSTGKIGKIVRAMWPQQYWHYVDDIAYIIGAALHPALIHVGEARGALSAPKGEARRFRSAKKFFRGFLFICHASPISSERIAIQIVLAQHKGHERIGEVRTSMCRALSIVKELAF